MALRALGRGVAAALRQPLAALLLYLLGLTLALVPAAAVGLGFDRLAGARPWAPTLLGEDWANQAVELVGAAGLARRPGGEVVGGLGVTALAIPLGALALALQGLGYNFLAGGILERLHGGARVPFWAGCRHWFWPFLRLGVLGTVLFGLLGVGGALALSVLGVEVALLAALGWLAVMNGWLELARAGMVARGERDAGRALGNAARLALDPRSLPHVLLVWLVLGLAGLALLAAQVWIAGAGRSAPDGAWSPVPLIAGQALLLAGAWLKVARLATALALDAVACGRSLHRGRPEGESGAWRTSTT